MLVIRWLIFSAVVAVLLLVDLYVTKRRQDKLPTRQAVHWYLLYVAAALAFCFCILLAQGRARALEFLTGYIIEVSLSVDNLFVFILIFASFGVKANRQPRVLKWGILGAIAMRIVLIVAGVALMQAFRWITYVFGLILVATAFRMAFGQEQEIDTDKHLVARAARKLFPLATGQTGQAFFVRRDHRVFATVLFLVLVMIEFSDLVFAVDSIPAVLAVTRDPFIAATSNIFAILGLRALYFIIAGFMNIFRLLKYGVALILCFVGIKMLLSELVHITVGTSLIFIVAVLAASVTLSLVIRPKPSSSD